MKAKSIIIYKDPKTNIRLNKVILDSEIEYFLFLDKNVLNQIQKKGIPVYSELKNYMRDNILIDPSTPTLRIVKQGVKQTKNFLMASVLIKKEFLSTDAEVISKLYPMIKYLENAGYYIDPSAPMKRSGKSARFTKKAFYEPQGVYKEVIDCQNGIYFFAEENEDKNIRFIVAISKDIEKIPFPKFKEFKLKMTTTPFSYMGSIYEEVGTFNYNAAQQYFSLDTQHPYARYDDYKLTFQNLAENICEISKEYYSVKGTEPSEPKSHKEKIEEQIEATQIAIQYSTGMSQEKIDELKEYLSTLELTLKYI